MIGEALAAACGDAGALARIGGPIGEAARAAAAGAAGRAQRAAWAAAARAPVPAGIRGVHASWIEAALVGLPARARADLARGGGDRAGVWLARWACAGIPPMPALRAAGEPARWPGDVAQATQLDAGELAGWLIRIGEDQVAALALRGGVHAGPALGDAIARIQRAPRAGALGPARAIIARCTGARLDGDGLIRVGARAIAPYVARVALARVQLMHRLPRPLGLAVGDELREHAGAPLDHCPGWAALAAP